MPKPEEALSAEEALHEVSDDEWRSAHEALVASGAIPENEGTYIWAPGVPGEQLDDRPQVDYEANEDG